MNTKFEGRRYAIYLYSQKDVHRYVKNNFTEADKYGPQHLNEIRANIQILDKKGRLKYDYEKH